MAWTTMKPRKTPRDFDTFRNPARPRAETLLVQGLARRYPKRAIASRCHSSKRVQRAEPAHMANGRLNPTPLPVQLGQLVRGHFPDAQIAKYGSKCGFAPPPIPANGLGAIASSHTAAHVTPCALFDHAVDEQAHRAWSRDVLTPPPMHRVHHAVLRRRPVLATFFPLDPLEAQVLGAAVELQYVARELAAQVIGDGSQELDHVRLGDVRAPFDGDLIARGWIEAE